MDVLTLMQKGHSNDEIAEQLSLSKNTIKTHVKTLFSAFQVSNRLECVRYAERIELI
jgi:DNA-binding NarL/FixJ family response regulator